MNTQIIKLGRVIPALIFLAVVGAVCFSYYHRSLTFREPGNKGKRILPENLSNATEGFSFFQSDQGRAKFEIRANVNLGFKDNRNLLESVIVKVFGKHGNRYDTITSDHCEYDQSAEEIIFSGNVVITLNDLGNGQSEHKVDSVPNDKVTTIRAPRITYLKATGIAKTEDLVRFARGRIHGTSKGLTYDANQETIRLHSAVEIFVDPEDARGSHLELHCETLDYYKAGLQIEMKSRVSVMHGYDSLEADLIRTWLREADSSVSRIDALGNVRSVSKDPRAQLEVTAQEVSYLFDSTGRWLERVIARQDVRSHSLDPMVRRDLSGEVVEITFRPNANLLESLHTKGDVVLLLADYKASPSRWQKAGSRWWKQDPRFEESCRPGDRRIKTPDLLVLFDSDGKQISKAVATGSSIVEAFPWEPEQDKTVLSAQVLGLLFGPDSQIQQVTADQKVQVDILSLASPRRTSTSDHLEAFVDRQSQQISQLHQTGNFRYAERDQRASAAEARYDADSKRTVLTGDPLVRDSQSRTSADLIEFGQLQNLVKARGNVRSVFEERQKQAQIGLFEDDGPIYASADFLEVQTQRGIAVYSKRAKLWQQDQVLRGDTITLHRSEKLLTAEKNVTSLFYLEDQSREAGKGKKERSPATVKAEQLVYEDRNQKATYSENVWMNSNLGTLQSRQLEVFLTSSENKKSVERMLATGSVKISQPGRLATSESAEFFQAEKKAILSGGTPRVLDSERGSTSGARLTLFFDDGSISVVGNPETRSITRQRVAR